jgi:HD-GYP domain-containing protein (c-di-GMP phosphodiesterase class II)
MNDFSQKWHPLGYDLLKAIAKLIQIGKLYEDNNNLAVEAVETFKCAIGNACQGEPQVSLQIYNGRFYLQQEKLPLFRKHIALFNKMMEFLEKRKIFGWHFQAGLDMVDGKDILLFTRLLDHSGKEENPLEWLVSELNKNNIHWVAVIQESNLSQDSLLEYTMAESETLERQKEAAKKTYQYALNSVKDVAQKLLSKNEVGIRKSVRMVQRMVDIIAEDTTTFMALSTIRMYDDYTYTHSLNVAILAMTLGKKIGMKRTTLERLGLCGLFHDLGKIEIPKNILNKKGKLDAFEYEEIKKHSMVSAMLILKLKTKKYHKGHLLISPFEHHIRYDHSGYPSIDKKRPLSLFGRILTIVDVFDAITSPRVYRPKSMSPDQALGYMLSDSGRYYDPALLKVFINMLGLYPVGTLLKLDTGEMGLVLHSNNGGDKDRPKVQLLIQGKDKSYEKGNVIDLSERNPRTGKYKRTIVQSLHPATLGIQPAHYIL